MIWLLISLPLSAGFLTTISTIAASSASLAKRIAMTKAFASMPRGEENTIAAPAFIGGLRTRREIGRQQAGIAQLFLEADQAILRAQR